MLKTERQREWKVRTLWASPGKAREQIAKDRTLPASKMTEALQNDQKSSNINSQLLAPCMETKRWGEGVHFTKHCPGEKLCTTALGYTVKFLPVLIVLKKGQKEDKTLLDELLLVPGYFFTRSLEELPLPSIYKRTKRTCWSHVINHGLQGFVYLFPYKCVGFPSLVQKDFYCII